MYLSGENSLFFLSWLTPGGNSSSSTWDFVLALVTDTTWVFSPPSGKSSELAKIKCQLLNFKVYCNIY